VVNSRKFEGGGKRTIGGLGVTVMSGKKNTDERIPRRGKILERTASVAGEREDGTQREHRMRKEHSSRPDEKN